MQAYTPRDFEKFLLLIESVLPAKEHNIRFKSPLVRAIANTEPNLEAIDSSQPIKWQTRRVIKNPQPFQVSQGEGCEYLIYGNDWFPVKELEAFREFILSSSTVRVGDRFWVKERTKVLQYHE